MLHVLKVQQVLFPLFLRQSFSEQKRQIHQLAQRCVRLSAFCKPLLRTGCEIFFGKRPQKAFHTLPHRLDQLPLFCRHAVILFWCHAGVGNALHPRCKGFESVFCSGRVCFGRRRRLLRFARCGHCCARQLLFQPCDQLLILFQRYSVKIRPIRLLAHLQRSFFLLFAFLKQGRNFLHHACKPLCFYKLLKRLQMIIHAVLPQPFFRERIASGKGI